MAHTRPLTWSGNRGKAGPFHFTITYDNRYGYKIFCDSGLLSDRLWEYRVTEDAAKRACQDAVDALVDELAS